MAKLHLPPSQASYTLGFTGPVSSILAGPKSRFRDDVKRNPYALRVRWFIDDFAFTYLRSFYRTIIKNGSLPFTVDIAVETQLRATYTAMFQSGSFSLNALAMPYFTVTALLDVKQL